MNDDAATVRATGTSFEVLQALRALRGAGVTAVADHLSIPKSTAHKHLHTLTELGYVTRDDGTYDLDVTFVSFGQYVRERDALFGAARDAVDRLAATTEETTGLYVERGGRGFDVYRVDGRAGERTPPLSRSLHGTAPGKAILAELPADRVERIVDRHGLPALTDHTITSRSALREELARVRDRSIAFDRDEHRDDVRGVAVPVTTDDDVLGALYVAGPADRLTGKWFDENIPGVVISAVNTVEQALRTA